MITQCRADGLDKLIIEITSDIFSDYPDDDKKSMEKDLGDIGLDVTFNSVNTIQVSIPMDLREIIEGTASGSDIVSEDEGSRLIRVDSSKLEKSNELRRFNNALNEFITESLKKKLRSAEFLPLTNYPEERLESDLREALLANRDFYLIDDYSNYLKANSTHSYEFNQFRAPYRTSDWADIAILIDSGKFDELREIYTSQLENTTWI